MPDTFIKIASVTVGSGGASSIDFTSIPSTYTDLCLKISSRTNRAAEVDDIIQIKPNNSSSSLTARWLRGDGSSAASSNNTTWSGGYTTAAAATASSFNNFEAYIPNYAGANNKSWSVDTVVENNATTGFAQLNAVLWSSTTAISSLILIPFYGSSFNQYSTATLYGIKSS